MNIERELSLINFSYYLKANLDQAIYVAFKYYGKFLNQQNKTSNLEQNCQDLEQSCKELEREQEELSADYELLRIALEKEQRKNIALLLRSTPEIIRFSRS